MDSKQATESYRGHKISVHATEVRPRVWAWDYLIAGRVQGNCRAGKELPDAEAALRRGMLAARARADELT